MCAYAGHGRCAGSGTEECMDALVDELIQKMGMTREQAEQAAKITINFLQKWMPSGTSGHIDTALHASQAETALEQGRLRLQGERLP